MNASSGFGPMRLSKIVCLVSLTILGCARTSPRTHSLDSDRYEIAEAALRYLMEAHSGHGVERNYYSAYVIEGGEFTSRLVAAFADYKPSVVAGAEVEIIAESGEARDKATGNRVKLWSVTVVKICGDRATAGVSWYSANLASAGHTIHLRRKNGRWVVESEQVNWIS
jgi:hypothetical protein